MISSIVKAMTHPDLQKELMEKIAKDMAEDIDFEVMCGLMKDIGWTQIKISRPKNITEGGAHEIKEWCRHNLTGNYKGRGQTWLFENSKDASMFVLRWK